MEIYIFKKICQIPFLNRRKPLTERCVDTKIGISYNEGVP